MTATSRASDKGRLALSRALHEQGGGAIAIIGMACRFPGAPSVEAYWRLLREGRDAIVEVPRSRWNVDDYYQAEPATPGKMNTRWGGFIEGFDQFDAGFFDIAPREAMALDPQQRLLLEIAWEALEDAGIDAHRLAGSATGVFLGASSVDYGTIVRDSTDVDAYWLTGFMHSVAAGRLSYVLDLQGPNHPIDTACSSSLVAVHCACESLRRHEANLALAGGVNMILDPMVVVGFSQARMMARDGRCKTFDARGDGYVRGEGCGIVVLKRLSDATQDGDHVLAVVRGSAENHDGRSQGLTAPNGLAQQALMRRALAAAGVTASEMDYVEAHGTGTSLGDPQELHALGEALAKRDDRAWRLVGSAKTNIGHLEAGAGIAGLIKLVLSLQHGEVPAHRNLEQTNPHIALESLRFAIPVESRPWLRTAGRRRIAGVSSFGFSGTNAHVVLEEAPQQEHSKKSGDRPLHLLTLSARSAEGLRTLARRYARYLAEHPAESIADVCFTANLGRSGFSHRLAVAVRSAADARGKLRRFARDEQVEGLQAGKAVSEETVPRMGFVCADRRVGGQDYPHELFATQPAFRRSMEQCAQVVDSLLGPAPRAVLLGEDVSQENREPPHDALLQFAIQYGLAQLWRSWGVEPAAVSGWGIGKYVAGCLGSVFDVEEGLRLTAAAARGDVELRRAASGVHLQPSRVALLVPGDGSPTEGGFWSDLDSGAAQGPSATQALRAHGCRLVLHMGLDGEDSAVGGVDEGLVCLGSAPHWTSLLASLGVLYARGAQIDWRGVDQGFDRRRLSLPTCAFERQRYWIQENHQRLDRRGSDEDSGSWLYRVGWDRQPSSPHGQAEQRPGRWLVLADTGALCERLRCSLLERGATCTTVLVPGATQSSGESIELAIEEIASAGEPNLQGVLCCWGLDAHHPARLSAATLEDAGAATHGVLDLLQALSGRRGDAPKLVLVTGAAQSVGVASDLRVNPVQSMLWGLARVIALEHPEYRCKCVDVGGHKEDARELAALMAEVLAPDDAEDQVALRGSERYVARLEPASQHACQGPRKPRSESRGLDPQDLRFREEGTYLISGGLGGIGLETARWMLEHGAGRVVLMGRHSPTSEAWDRLSSLPGGSARVEFVQGDVSAASDVVSVVSHVEREGRQLCGIVHAAGVLDDGVLLQQDWPRFARVLAPKVLGSWNLHQTTASCQLDFFVMFSSSVSLLGNGGQGNYAAANAFMDGLAHYRRSIGLPAATINWGPWGEVGMAAADRERRERPLTARGMRSLTTRGGLEAFGTLLTGELPAVAVVRTDWQKYADSLGRASVPALLSRLVQPRASSSSLDTSSQLRVRLRSASPGKRMELLREYVIETVGKVLGLAEGKKIPLDQPLRDVGMDSLMAVEIRNLLQAELGRPLLATLVFEYPTLDALSDFMLREIPEATAADEGTAAVQSEADPVARILDQIRQLSQEQAAELASELLGGEWGKAQ